MRSALAEAELVLTSEITTIECERTLVRVAHSGTIRHDEASAHRETLRAIAAHWSVLPLGAEIAERARRPFPAEPVRTLDAIHLASLVVARAIAPDVRVLSLDRRIRRNASELGFELVPE